MGALGHQGRGHAGSKSSGGGRSVGRYQLLRELGRGASGIVFAAWDPDLDRNVAIKLIPASRDLDGRSGERLLREAQLLAQLSHPNVVAVHDVARIDAPRGLEELEDEVSGGIYVVMELVEGPDLARWCSSPRDVEETLAVLIEAGRGLAAAHRAGLIHRDLKPENINVGDDGRVRVLDFGLATTSEAARSGALVGSPAYMAPELHAGGPATPSTDQYAYGVTVFEALVGQLPFVGDPALLPELKREGPLFPDRPRIAARVRRALTRAMAPDPRHRFASMDALIAALSGDRARKRQVLLMAGLAALTVSALALGARPDPPAPLPSCEDARRPVAAIWDEPRRQRVATAFASTSLTDARDTWRRAEARIDRYLDQWTRLRHDACHATHVEHTRSESLLDLQEACLGRRLGRLDALLSELEVADAGVVTMAVLAVDDLQPLEPCADLEALLRGTPPPANPEVARHVTVLEHRLAKAGAARAAGRYAEARRRAAQVLEDAEEVAHPPLTIASHLELSSIALQTSDWRAGMDHALVAATEAERVREESLAADAWIQLVWHAGVEGELQDEATRWLALAEAAVDRLGEDPLRRAELAHSRAGLRYRQGRYPEALDGYEEALALQRAFLGAEHPAVPTTLNHIANVNIMAGDYAAATQHSQASLELRRRILGAHHPKVAACHNNLAASWSRAGNPARAIEQADASLAIVGGTGAAEERIALRIRAAALRELGRTRDADDAAARADALERSTRGD